MKIKIVNVGNCIMCGKKIKIVVTRGNAKSSDIFLCTKCKRKEWVMNKERNEAFELGFKQGQHFGKQATLDKVGAEIKKQEKWLWQAGINPYNVDIAFSAIKSVVTKSEG